MADESLSKEKRKWLMKSISHPSSEGTRGPYHLGPTISIFYFGKWGQKINDLELKPIFIKKILSNLDYWVHASFCW